jgi:hypothetical protein
MKTIKVGQYVKTSAGVGRVVRVRGDEADVYGPGLDGGGKPWMGKRTWLIIRGKNGHWKNDCDKYCHLLLPAKKPRKGK